MVDIEGTCGLTGKKCMVPCDARTTAEQSFWDPGDTSADAADYILQYNRAQGAFGGGRGAERRGADAARPILARRIRAVVATNPVLCPRNP